MRPEGFKKCIEVRDDVKRYTGADLNKVYEAGADAYEAALKASGIRQLLQDPVLHYEHWHNKWGTVCFIEEE